MQLEPSVNRLFFEHQSLLRRLLLERYGEVLDLSTGISYRTQVIALIRRPKLELDSSELELGLSRFPQFQWPFESLYPAPSIELSGAKAVGRFRPGRSGGGTFRWQDEVYLGLQGLDLSSQVAAFSSPNQALKGGLWPDLFHGGQLIGLEWPHHVI